MLSLRALAVVALPSLAAAMYGGACVDTSEDATCSSFQYSDSDNYMCVLLSCTLPVPWYAMCEAQDCPEYPEEIISVSPVNAGVYRASDGTNTVFTPQSSEASHACGSGGCYSAGSACYDGWTGSECGGFQTGLYYGMPIGGTTTDTFTIPYDDGDASVDIPVTKDDVTYEDGDQVAVWWGVKISGGTDSSYDLLYIQMLPWIVDQDGAGPTSGAYLQNGAWTGSPAVGTPVTAVKCSFGDGRSYYFSFFEKMVFGGVSEEGLNDFVLEGNMDVYYNSDGTWSFSFNSDLISDMTYFAAPLYIMCPGETDCFEDNSAGRVSVVSAARARAAAGAAAAAGVLAAAAL